MKNSLKKSLSVALATITMLTCFANNTLTHAKDKEKIPLILTFNALENPHSGHTFYSGIGQDNQGCTPLYTALLNISENHIHSS